MRNRTADLLLTMETLCLLSYRGASAPRCTRHQRTKIHTRRRAERIHAGLTPPLKRLSAHGHEIRPYGAFRIAFVALCGETQSGGSTLTPLSIGRTIGSTGGHFSL